MAHESGRLCIVCPDRPGIVAAVSKFLYQNGANISQSDQYTTHPENGLFFMRIEFDMINLSNSLASLEHDFSQLAQSFDMEWTFTLAAVPKRIAIFVSKELHCLQELLWRWQMGELFADITTIVSNHPDAEPLASSAEIPFVYLPVTKERKNEVEHTQLEVVASTQTDLVVLARYMQILSPSFVQQLPHRILNIHHSFLPAFVGQNPYGRAYERGVKLIGATAHYVTEELDAGPIVEQDVQRVDHRFDAAELKQIGRHIERVVLARAVKWHVEDRILVHGNKTIVFS